MQIHAPSRSVLLKLKNPELVRQCIPKHKPIAIDGHNLAVRHGLEEVKVLRNLGVMAPSPILHYYDWPGKYKPFAHQYETAAFLTLNRRAFVLSEMGTSKTASVLWATDYLMNEGHVKKVLVVSPLSTLRRVWLDELFAVLMHRRVAVLHGSRQNRLDLLAKDFDFYIINHDGLAIIADEVRKRMDIDMVIVDEASAYRNSQTNRFKVLTTTLRADQRLVLMTGTPCPNAPTDAWALARIVNPGKVPRYFGQFQRMTMMQVSQYKWIPKPEAYTIAFEAMHPAIRHRKKDCIDLPPVMVEKRECGVTKEQAKAYRDMKNYFAAETGGAEVTAVNAADKIGKLRQILCGSVKDPDTGKYHDLDHAPRLETLLECIEEASAKVVVVVPFKGITLTLEKEVAPHYSCAVLNGDVTVARRDHIIKQFKNEKDPHVLIVHPKVAAHGLNLTEADMIVFYAPIYSNDEYQQVMERINRAGQVNKMTIIKIGASELEWDIYRLLEGKRMTQENILSLYENELTRR